MRNLPSYPSDVPTEPFVARLLALRDGPPEPATRTPFEEATVSGTVVRIGLAVPEQPIPPVGMQVTGYMVHTVPHTSRPAAYDAADLADAVRKLLLRGVQTHEIMAFAGIVDTEDSITLGVSSVYDATARAWGPWGNF